MGYGCGQCKIIYEEKDGIPALLPPLSSLKKGEAEYHANFEEDSVEVHQLLSWRNLFYHQKLWRFFDTLPECSRILEVCGGSGFDAKRLLPRFYLTETDIAVGSLSRLKQNLSTEENKKIYLVAADAENLPFANDYFDGSLMVASLHHLPEPFKCLLEMRRILKPGGLLAIGVEPNYFYFHSLKKIQKQLYLLSHSGGEHSPADEEADGFKKKELKKIVEKAGFEIIAIKPMWLLAGFIHYFLEFVFRALKLKKRIKLPILFERAIVGFDEIIFKIPFIDRVGWHWNIFLRNSK